MSHETPFSSSGEPPPPRKMTGKRRKFVVNREINEHGQTPPERRDDTVDEPIIPAPNAIESMKRKHEERLEKQKKEEACCIRKL